MQTAHVTNGPLQAASYCRLRQVLPGQDEAIDLGQREALTHLPVTCPAIWGETTMCAFSPFLWAIPTHYTPIWVPVKVSGPGVVEILHPPRLRIKGCVRAQTKRGARHLLGGQSGWQSLPTAPYCQSGFGRV